MAEVKRFTVVARLAFTKIKVPGFAVRDKSWRLTGRWPRRWRPQIGRPSVMQTVQRGSLTVNLLGRNRPWKNDS